MVSDITILLNFITPPLFLLKPNVFRRTFQSHSQIEESDSSLVMSALLVFRLSAWFNLATTGQKFREFYINVFS
jgi:hypothetical protein